MNGDGSGKGPESSADDTPIMGRRPSREMLDLCEGDTITLTDGTVRTVLDNPHDGVWVICEALDGGDEEEMVQLSEVSALTHRPTGESG